MCKITDKQTLRRQFKQIRKSMSAEQKACADREISDRFLSSDSYKKCRNLLIYVSSDIEVGTRAVIEQALKEKNVFCPKCVSGTNIMEFYRIQSTDDLSVGSYGILEPDGSSEMYSGGALSLCVVPALSYDFSGYRLGFGKGYYDRFLADFDGEKVGLCYESCLIRSLPHDDFDICADWLVTENKFITFSKG